MGDSNLSEIEELPFYDLQSDLARQGLIKVWKEVLLIGRFEEIEARIKRSLGSM